MNRVVHFEIHADDTQRAIAFYQAIVGWTFTRWGAEEFWTVKTGPDTECGINGGLMKRRGAVDGTAVIGYVCTLQVESVDEAVTKACAHGGQHVVPKMAIPGIGWLAYCKDTEGNIFGVMQEDKGAR